ncbi:Os02g0645725, partial [Oryza sativa Japonica Group]
GDGRRGGRHDDGGLLLAAHLEHLAVGVGVQAADERRAAGRPVLREEAARLVADAAGVAERLGALGAGAPLGRLLDAAVAAAAVARGGEGGAAAGGGGEVRRLLRGEVHVLEERREGGRRRAGRGCRGGRRRRRVGQGRAGERPHGGTRPLAPPRLHRHQRLRRQRANGRGAHRVQQRRRRAFVRPPVLRLAARR